jgi:hypothetical protein
METLNTFPKARGQTSSSKGGWRHSILAQGKTVKTEKISYKAFQKCFGRSVKVRSFGMNASKVKLLKPDLAVALTWWSVTFPSS